MEDKEHLPAAYYAKIGDVSGPYTERQLRQLYYAGALSKKTAVWKEGDDTWDSYSRLASSFAPLRAAIEKLTGLKPRGRLKSVHFFSQVLKKHSREERRETIHGTAGATLPPPAAPAPWLYSRYLLFGFILAALCLASAPSLGSFSLILFSIIISLTIPPATYILLTELNVERTLPLWSTLIHATLITLLLTIPICVAIPITLKFPAGFIEEPAKLLTALLLAQMMGLRLNRVLTGLMLGCAVGASFACLETILYIGNAYDEGGISAMLTTSITRMLTSSFTHTLWTGMTVGAFCLAQRRLEQAHGDTPTKNVNLAALCSRSFLRIGGMAILLHAVFNGLIDCIETVDNIVNLKKNHLLEATQVVIILGYLPSLVIICYTSWSIVMRLVDSGLEQAERDPATPGTAAPPACNRLYCLSLSGRLGRGAYCCFCLIQLILGVLILVGFKCIPDETSLHNFFDAVLFAYILSSAIYGTSATARRLQDAGRSRWWLPFIFPFILCSLFLLGLPLACLRSKIEQETPPSEPHSAEPPLPPAPQQRAAEPGLHGESIFCPTCDGLGTLPGGEPCPTCMGEGIVPLSARIEPPPLPPPDITSGSSRLLFFITFKGRITRSSYWLILLGFGITLAAESYLPAGEGILVLMSLLYISGTVRRLHDVGLSGWWILLLLPANTLLLLPTLILAFIDSRPASNRWGVCPKR